jgi:hypothetical protein
VSATYRRTGMNEPTALDSAMHSVWLNADWHFLTRKMTTDEREAAADAVDRYHRLIADEDGDLALPITGLRWWRE